MVDKNRRYRQSDCSCNDESQVLFWDHSWIGSEQSGQNECGCREGREQIMNLFAAD